MKKAGFIIPIFLFLSALADAVLRVAYLGVDNGLNQIFNDPGKIPFHLIVMPLIAYNVFGKMKVHTQVIKRFKELTLSYKICSLIGTSLIIAVAFSSLSVDLHNGFCKRSKNPQDVKDASIREKLQESWIANHKKAFEYVRNESNPDSVKNNSLKIKNAYNQYLEKLLHLKKHTDAETISPFYKCGYFLHNASLVVYFDFFLTISAILITALLLVLLIFAILSYLVRGTKLTPQTFVSSFETLSLIPIWIVFRVYSEYYNNFFWHDTTQYAGMNQVLIYLILTNVLLFMLFFVQYRNFSILTEGGLLYPLIVNAATIFSAFGLFPLLSTKGLLITLFEFNLTHWLLIYFIIFLIFLLLIKPVRNNG